MEFGPKRGHILFIFENFFKDFSLLLLALIIGLLQGDMNFVLENAGVLVIVLIGPIGRVVRYATTYYTVDAEKLTVKSGLFKKNTLEVPLATVTTVDFSQGLLHQLCGAYRLNVDNAGSLASDSSKLQMTFGKEDAFAVRNLLIRGRDGLDGFNLGAMGEDTDFQDGEANGEQAATCQSGALQSKEMQSGEIQSGEIQSGESRNAEISSGKPQRRAFQSAASHQGKRIQIKAGDLLLYGLLKSKITFFIELIALASSAMAIFNLSDDFLFSFAEDAVLRVGVGYAALAGGALVFAVAVISGTVGSLIRYYGFEIMDNGQAIKIEYGLLTKKRYTIQKNRVSGFSYEQSFLMKLFGMGTLQLFAIGYGEGDESTSEEPIVFPLIQKDKVREAMTEILPEMAASSDYIKAAKGSLPYFFYGFGFFLALALFAASLYCSLYVNYCRQLWIPGLLMLGYSIAGRVQEYKNAAIYGNDDNISIVSGGFQKNTIFIKSTHVESVTAKAGKWKAGKGIASIEISYIAPLLSSKTTASNVPVSAYEAVRKRLIY